MAGSLLMPIPAPALKSLVSSLGVKGMTGMLLNARQRGKAGVPGLVSAKRTYELPVRLHALSEPMLASMSALLPRDATMKPFKWLQNLIRSRLSVEEYAPLLVKMSAAVVSLICLSPSVI